MTAIAEGYNPASATASASARESSSHAYVAKEARMPKHVPKLEGVEPGPYPFSQVVEANGFVFLAGQVGDAPGSHGAVPGGIEAQTRAMLDNVGRLLTAAGLAYTDVVRCAVYLRDFDDFAAMNAVYREYFPTEPPARATVGVTALAADYAIEIEVTAAR
jgi:2-iminobutanoate/2-iminopropanoate deaminase